MEKYVYVCPDAGPILCGYEEPDTSGGNWQEDEQNQMIEKVFDHLSDQPRLYWLAMLYIAYVETVNCDNDRKASDYLSCVMDELSIYASEHGDSLCPSYDPERDLENLLEETQNIWDYEIGRARIKTRESFLTLIEHELSMDVS